MVCYEISIQMSDTWVVFLVLKFAELVPLRTFQFKHLYSIKSLNSQTKKNLIQIKKTYVYLILIRDF